MDRRNTQQNGADGAAYQRLVAADPFAHNTTTLPRPRKSQQTLFDETIGRTDESVQAGVGSFRPRRGLRPAFVALALLVAIGVTIGLRVNGDATTTIATFGDAVERTAAIDSGQATIIMELREIDGMPGAAQVTVDYRFEADDYQVNLDIEGLDSPELPSTTQIQSDGITYVQTGDDPDFRIVPELQEDDLVTEFGLTRQAVTAQSLAPLVAESDGFAEVTASDDGNERLFVGTVTRDELLALEARELPAPLSLVAGYDLYDLPESVDVEATVRNGLLHRVVTTVDGEAPGGTTDFTITTTYDAFGEDQGIAAPEQLAQPS